MDDILDKLLDSDRSDLDDDIGMGDESDIDSDWEYEYEDERVFCGGGVGDADHGGVVGDADVVGADVDGGVGHADCGAGSSVVRDGSIEDSVRRDSGDECGGLVGGGDYDQSDNDDVDSGGDGYCLLVTETEGLKVRMNQQQNVLDFLQLYLTDEMLELIVIETNRFANQLFLKNPDKAANSYLKN